MTGHPEKPLRVKIDVPVNRLELHMVACIEQGFSWFRWLRLERKGDGYGRAEVMVFDESFEAVTEDARAKVIADNQILAPVLRWEDNQPVFLFDEAAFVRGLGRCVEQGVGQSMVASIRYEGDGEWDIDAGGADCIVQLAIFKDLIFG